MCHYAVILWECISEWTSLFLSTYLLVFVLALVPACVCFCLPSSFNCVSVCLSFVCFCTCEKGNSFCYVTLMCLKGVERAVQHKNDFVFLHLLPQLVLHCFTHFRFHHIFKWLLWHCMSLSLHVTVMEITRRVMESVVMFWCRTLETTSKCIRQWKLRWYCSLLASLVSTSADRAVRNTVTEALRSTLCRHFITELELQHSSVFFDSVTIHEIFTSQPWDTSKGT